MSTQTPKRTLKLYIISAIFGIIGGLLTISTIFVLDFIINTIWGKLVGIDVDNPTRTYASIIAILLFGLLIGVFSKKFGAAKGSIETVIDDALEKGEVDPKVAFKNVIIALLSIGSGASLGPEAPSAMIASGVTSFAAKGLGTSKETERAMNLSSVSGMLGSLLSSPFVATAMFVESAKDHVSKLRDVISYSFIAGSFGMATFFMLFGKLYAFNFGVPAYDGPTEIDLLKAFVFGLGGAIFAVIIGLVLRALEPAFKKLDKKLIVRSLVGAVIAGGIAFALPLTMFSGQHTMSTLISNAATTSIIMLLLLAVGKMLATTILLRTGFFGGPIFPAVFAGAALGIALNGLLDAPITVALAGTIAGIITVSIRQPLAAAFLVVAITGASTVAPVALGVSAAIIIVSIIERKQATAKE
jgi:H+/Cl- antiporter ClcA